MQDKLAWALRMRADAQATVPSLLSEERSYNPFMRVHMPAVRAAVTGASKARRGNTDAGGGSEVLAEVPALAALRALKDAKAHLSTQDAPPLPGGEAAGAAGVRRN